MEKTRVTFHLWRAISPRLAGGASEVVFSAFTSSSRSAAMVRHSSEGSFILDRSMALDPPMTPACRFEVPHGQRVEPPGLYGSRDSERVSKRGSGRFRRVPAGSSTEIKEKGSEKEELEKRRWKAREERTHQTRRVP